MRKKLIAANWKMHLVPDEARALIAALIADLGRETFTDREVLIAPAAILIPEVKDALKGSSIMLGAQNMFYQANGAFTGEISPTMLLAYGVSHVIVGHSERRHIFGESDELVGRKVRAALDHKMTPILCVGETQEEHDRGRALEVVLRQMEGALGSLTDDEAGAIVLAYEPVWAIGTGRTATPEQAQSIQGAIRGAFNERFGHGPAQLVRILYGGSVNAHNVDSLLSKPDIDGALVGTASLKADSFARIVRARAAK